MSTILNKQKTTSRKTSLNIHQQSCNIPESTLTSPKASYWKRQLSNMPVPMTQRQEKKVEETIQINEMSCQNYFLRKTILVLYRFFEKMGVSWNFDQLSYKQVVLILKELRYIKGTEKDKGIENSEQLRKCYYLWVNLAQKRLVRLTNLIVVLCHLQNLEIDIVLIEDVVSELAKGISKFEQEHYKNGDPNFIFLVKSQNWLIQEGLVRLNPKQIKQLQAQLSSLRYTRLTESDPKLELEQQSQENPPVMMSKKSVELASNKRQKILKEIKQNQQVETIELYHILNYKKQLGKPAVSKLEECYPEPKKKKTQKKTSKIIHSKKDKEKTFKEVKAQNKQNKRSNNVMKKAAKQKQKTEDIGQLSELLGDDLGVSEITKTQIVDDLSFNYVPDQFEQEDKNNGCIAPHELILPESMIKAEQKAQKRRDYIELPILYVDVNIEDGKKERIVVYEGDTAERLAADFGRKHGLCEETVGRLEGLLAQQIGSVLSKIDEAAEEDCSYLY